MRNRFAIAILTCILAATSWAAANALRAAEQDEKPVAEAMGRFYSALDALFKGEVGPMEDVWSHAADVTYMGPGGGMQVGWKDVLANWKVQAAKRLGGAVKAEKTRMHVGQDIAVTCCYEVGENIVDGKPQKVSIRATSVFRTENGQWKMIGHHTDLLPFLEK